MFKYTPHVIGSLGALSLVHIFLKDILIDSATKVSEFVSKKFKKLAKKLKKLAKKLKKHRKKNKKK